MKRLLLVSVNWLLISGSSFHPQPPSLLAFFPNLGQKDKFLARKPNSPCLGSEFQKVLETVLGAILATFSLVRISIRDLVADRNPYQGILGLGVGPKFDPHNWLHSCRKMRFILNSLGWATQPFLMLRATKEGLARRLQ